MPKILSATKHFYVQQKLRSELQTFKPGSVVPTVSDLADRYEVSHATVVRALSAVRRDGMIVRRAGTKRYRVAQHAAKPLSRIALARLEWPSLDLDVTIQSIVQAGRERSWAFDLVHFDSLLNLDIGRATGDNDALILLPSVEEMPEHMVRAMRRPRKPILLLQQHYELPAISSVTIDDEQVGRLAAEHLIDLGHKRCLIVLDQHRESTINARHAGWCEVMNKRLNIPQAEIPTLDPQIKPLEDSRDRTYEAFRSMLRRGDFKFTALFCTSNPGAMAVLRVLHEEGVAVPDQISVIAFSGESNAGAYFYPALSAIEMDISQYGVEVIEELSRHQADPNATHRQIMIEPFLMARQSTKSLNT